MEGNFETTTGNVIEVVVEDPNVDEIVEEEEYENNNEKFVEESFTEEGGEEEEEQQQPGDDGDASGQIEIVPAPPDEEEPAAAADTTANSSTQENNESVEDGEGSPAKKGEDLDLEQCRCCMSKDDLVDIFSYNTTDKIRISDKIKILCTSIKIYERDFMPHWVCKSCVEKLQIAIDFKESCENTDRELKKNRSRSKTKVRRRNTNFVLIDYEPSDNSENDIKMNKDDDDFKLSDEDVPSEVDDSDVSYTEEKKPGKRRGRKPGTTMKKKPATPVTPVYVKTTPGRGGGTGRGRGRGRPPKTPRPVEPESDSSLEVVPVKTSKLTCDKCNESLPRGPRAAKHVCKTLPQSKLKQIAVVDVAFRCQPCDMTFKLNTQYTAHQALHKEFTEVNACIKCHKKCASKADLKKHLTIKCQKTRKNECLTCGKIMASESRLIVHFQGKCSKPEKEKAAEKVVSPAKSAKSPAAEGEPVNTGRNLFKCVAPMTSTYWSDSFSD